MKQGQKSLFVLFLLTFLVGIIFIGQSSSGTTKLVTIQIDGIDNQELYKKVETLISKVEGIQTIFIDGRANLCTFRYDSGKVDLDTVQRQLAGLGLNVKPVKAIHLLEESRKTGKSKLFSIEVESASEH